MTGKLYMVATPIGNLQDITLRALEILKNVDLILAEDTRVTRNLLSKFEIKTSIESYHQHSTIEKRLFILNKILNGESIALVTDAGTPGVSDPGNELLDFLYENVDILEVVGVPGASSLTTVISVSGFDCQKFSFLGFFPKKTSLIELDIFNKADFATIYFDSPHRVLKNLEKLTEIINENRRVLVARELTKMYETLYRGTLDEVIKKLKAEKNVKGEIVVVVEALHKSL